MILFEKVKWELGKSRDQVSMNLSQMSYGKIFTRPNNRVTKLTMRGRKTSLCSGEVGASEREPEPVSCSCRQEASEWWRRRWRGRWRGSRGSQRFYTGLPPPQTSPQASPELGHLTRVYTHPNLRISLSVCVRPSVRVSPLVTQQKTPRLTHYPQADILIQGVFFPLPPPKSSKYEKVNLG